MTLSCPTRIWKKIQAKQKLGNAIHFHSIDAACGLQFNVGEEYLLTGNFMHDGRAFINVCDLAHLPWNSYAQKFVNRLRASKGAVAGPCDRPACSGEHESFVEAVWRPLKSFAFAVILWWRFWFHFRITGIDLPPLYLSVQMCCEVSCLPEIKPQFQWKCRYLFDFGVPSPYRSPFRISKGRVTPRRSVLRSVLYGTEYGSRVRKGKRYGKKTPVFRAVLH